MSDLTTFAAFVAAVLAMQLVPGPDTMLIVSRGIGQGTRIALCTALGATVVAGLIQLPLLALGIGSAVQAWPLAFDVVRHAGAAYLIWLGARLLMRRARPVRAPGAVALPRTTALAAVRQGMIVNLTNPNPTVFMLAFLPQFVDPAGGSVALQMLMLGAVQKGSGFVVLGSTAMASGVVGGWLARRPGVVAWQERFAGAVMVALGLRLLLSPGGR